MLHYFWNSVTLWQALSAEQELPALQQYPEGVHWVLWRAPGYTIQFYSLAPAEAWCLNGIVKGLSFGQLCEGLCQWIEPEQVGLQAASYLKGWIQNGMVRELLVAH